MCPASPQLQQVGCFCEDLRGVLLVDAFVPDCDLLYSEANICCIVFMHRCNSSSGGPGPFLQAGWRHGHARSPVALHGLSLLVAYLPTELMGL